MRLVLLVGVAGLGAAYWLGCGGAASSDVVDGTDGGGDAAAEASGSSGTSGSSGSTSGAPSDGGINPADAGPGGTTTTLTCGATSCAIPSQTCCLEQLASGTAYSCSAAGAACPGASADAGGNGNGNNGDTVSLKCSSAANCAAGTVCCVQQVNNGAPSECKATCGNNSAQLCDKNATVTGCAAADMCSSRNINDWNLPATYATCGGKGN